MYEEPQVKHAHTNPNRCAYFRSGDDYVLTFDANNKETIVLHTETEKLGRTVVIDWRMRT